MDAMMPSTLLAFIALLPLCSATFTPPVTSTCDADAQKEIVDTHNKWRNQVQPPNPVEMKTLAWHDGLAAMAQAWADKCIWDHGDPEWTKDVIGPDGNPIGASRIGQNMWKGSSANKAWSSVVDGWDAEKADYDFCKPDCAPNKACGHYKQVVWASTTHVGCGKKTCTGHTIIVCNYLPAGNYAGDKGPTPYKLSESDQKSFCPAPTSGGLALKIIVPSVVGVIVIAAAVTTLVVVLT